MSYVQGSTVRLTADFSDAASRAPRIPDEVILTVQPPTAAIFTKTLSAGEVKVDEAAPGHTPRPGRVFYLLETISEPGTWRYQFEDPASGMRTVARKEITVTRRLTA